MHLVIRAFGAEVLAVEVADADPATIPDEHDVNGGQFEMPFGLSGDPWGHTASDADDRARRSAR